MPVSSELLEILVCPESKQPVRPAGEDVLAKLNAEVEAGTLRSRGGDAVGKRIEEALIREALGQTDTNVTRSARLLGISRRSLQSKMKELGLRDAQPPSDGEGSSNGA